jgi:hypothetical protein
VTSCIVDSAAIYIMVVKFRNTICPPQPQLSLHRRAALSSNSNGTRSFIAERTQSAVYIVRCLWYQSILYTVYRHRVNFFLLRREQQRLAIFEGHNQKIRRLFRPLKKPFLLSGDCVPVEMDDSAAFLWSKKTVRYITDTGSTGTGNNAYRYCPP